MQSVCPENMMKQQRERETREAKAVSLSAFPYKLPESVKNTKGHRLH